MADWKTHYDAIYDALGVSAVITSGSTGAQITITAIDKTSGIVVGDSEIGTHNLTVQSVRPAAVVRCEELNDGSFARTDLDGSNIVLNGKTWKIKSHLLRQSPEGEDAGEVYLLLGENF